MIKFYDDQEGVLIKMAEKCERTNKSLFSLEDDLKIIDLYCHSNLGWTDIGNIVNHPARSCRYRISLFAKQGKLNRRVHKEVNPAFFSENACGHPDKCFECPFPACVFDGYHPNQEKTNIRTGNWDKKETLKLKRLYKLYTPEVLANIMNRKVDDVKLHLIQFYGH